MACELAFRSALLVVRPHRSDCTGRADRIATSMAVPAVGAGGTRYSPVNSGLRFSNIALMPSPRSRDGRNAEFQAAT